MKRLLSLAAFISLFTIAYSQEFHYGVFAGTNLSTMKIGNELYLCSDVDNCKKQMTVGFHGGAFAEYSFNKYLGVQAEFSYSQYGYRLKIDKEDSYALGEMGSMVTHVTGKGGSRIDNINLSLLFKCYLFNKRVAIDFGVQPNWALSARRQEEIITTVSLNDEVMNEEVIDTTFNLKKGSEFHPFNFSVVGGATYYINENIFLSARYIFGLKDIFMREVGYFTDDNKYYTEIQNQISKNRVIQIALGWRF